jgi:hypothetical protein
MRSMVVDNLPACKAKFDPATATDQKMRPACRRRKFRPLRKSIKARETARDKRSRRRPALAEDPASNIAQGFV